MKLKSVLLCVPLFIGITISSCKKDEIETLIQYVEVRDTINVRDTISVQDTIYVYIIDTTKKITINEIKFFGDKFMVVGTDTWRGVAYGNGRWVVVGAGGKIATSTGDGTSWSTQTVGTDTWMGVAFKTD
jgi:hypothetical protein